MSSDTFVRPAATVFIFALTSLAHVIPVSLSRSAVFRFLLLSLSQYSSPARRHITLTQILRFSLDRAFGVCGGCFFRFPYSISLNCTATLAMIQMLGCRSSALLCIPSVNRTVCICLLLFWVQLVFGVGHTTTHIPIQSITHHVPIACADLVR